MSGHTEGPSARSMYETEPHYMQALETIHRVVRERDAMMLALEEIVERSQTSFHIGSKASAELASVALAAIAKVRS